MESAISAEYRDHLRHLKVEFDEAYAQVDLDMDRSDPLRVAAEEAYKAWSGAIDRYGLALLDDLEIVLADNASLKEA